MPATSLIRRCAAAMVVSATLLAGQLWATTNARADPLPIDPAYGLAGVTVTVTPSVPTETKCVLYVDGVETDSFGCGPNGQGETFTISGAPGDHPVLVCVSTCDPADAGSSQQQATFAVQTRVPDLRGLTVRDATQRLTAAGLALGTVHAHGNHSAHARIVHQSRAPGTAAFVKSAVNVRLPSPGAAPLRHQQPTPAVHSAAVGALAAATPRPTAAPGGSHALWIGLLLLAVLVVAAVLLLTRAMRRTTSRARPDPHITVQVRGAAQHVTMRPTGPRREPDVVYTARRTSTVTMQRANERSAGQ